MALRTNCRYIILNYVNKKYSQFEKLQQSGEIGHYTEKLDIIFKIDSYTVILSKLDICTVVIAKQYQSKNKKNVYV